MSTSYAKKLAQTALDQYKKYQFVHEGDPPLKGQIKRYWNELGFAFPGVGTAWSAIFVSWCVMKAGADKTEFHFAQAHSVFVHWAIQNAKNQTGLFQGFDIGSYSPQIGDIIQNNRGSHQFDYAFAAKNKHYESHSAIVVETGQDEKGFYALTVGGNESDSVRRTAVRLNSKGRIIQREVFPFISVIRNLK